MADEEQKPDERPRPQYGELAPEGWVWHPPADANRLDTSHPVAETDRYGEHGTADAGQRPARSSQYERPGLATRQPQNPSTQLRADAPRWNMTITVVLIVFGFFGATNSIGGLLSLPDTIQFMHSSQNLGDYTPAASVQGTLIAGAVTIGLIWAISTGLSIWLLVKRRLAFYIPLIAGVIALIALLGFMSAVLLTDPVLIDFYSGITPTPSPTGTP